MLADKRESV